MSLFPAHVAETEFLRVVFHGFNQSYERTTIQSASNDYEIVIIRRPLRFQYGAQRCRNELRLNIAPTAFRIVIHKLPPKKRTCKRQQQRVTEIIESAVSEEESTFSFQNQEPGETNKTQKNSKRQHQQPLHLTNEQHDDILTLFQVIVIVGTVYLVLLMKSLVLLNASS
ncbi:hypothetical protein DPMN_058592 [Dreissena polymorpha]|uniref:Uncharacterized protein n=1 Tax=Dreissena polymorpha TaxID=45954 RepID=A0A9D4HFL8_DREPO|nr:hypothetical protein DPMN_058592 [Dreissena polymorpha]